MEIQGSQGTARRLSINPLELGLDTGGIAFVGRAVDVIRAVSDKSGMDELDVIKQISHCLLAKKGADWTSSIVSEYLGLYEDSMATCCLVWDESTHSLVSHACVLQSSRWPWIALLAHVRTEDAFRGRGLGSYVTRQATEAAFRHGAGVAVLATDDKVHRIAAGERAAHSMYSKLGYAILGEQQLADTRDWLMATDAALFKMAPSVNAHSYPELRTAKEAFTKELSASFCQPDRCQPEPVATGDLPALFLLLNLSPADDFRLKLSSWRIHRGPELERAFVATLRQAILDQDRLHDASLVLRDQRGAIVAICAALQQTPFTRSGFDIDIYSVPQWFQSHMDLLRDFTEQTIDRVRSATERPTPCQLRFIGSDSAKVQLMESLGFSRSDGYTSYQGSHPGTPLIASHYILDI